MTASRTQPRIVVIGAGISGLACAADLVQAGHSVTILEARSRMGGRMHTDIETLDGISIDLGASFIHGLAGNPLYHLSQKLGLRLHRCNDAPMTESSIFSPDGPPLPLPLAKQLSQNSETAFFETMAEHAQNDAEGVPSAHASLADYMNNQGRAIQREGLGSTAEVAYVHAMRSRWNGWTGAEQHEVSLRYWQSDVTFRGPDAVVVDGYKGIYEHLAGIVRDDAGSRILHEKEVVAIRRSYQNSKGNIIDIDTTSPHGLSESFAADFVVCTLPLGVLKARPPVFQPAMPRRRLDAIARIGMGMLNKVVLSYRECFWPANEAIITLLPSSASKAFMPILHDRALILQNYVPIKGTNLLVVYCDADFAIALEQLSDAEIQSGMHSILQHHFGDQPNFPQSGPEKYVVTRWLSDPFSRGAYAYVRATPEGVHEQNTPFDFNELARPLWDDRLLFAGEATDADGYACVHGPLLTGKREAARILAKLEQIALEGEV